MKVEFDISKCSNQFLYELVTLIDSPDVLKEIVDYAINVAHYNEQGPGFNTDEDYYLDAVVRNPKTPLESILAIIEYQNATYARWGILERVKLDNVHIEQFAKFETDFSMICMLIEKISLTSQLANIIADRMIKNEVKMTKVINDDYSREEVLNQYMEFIIHKCSGEWKEKLKKWHNENSMLDIKFNNLKYAYRFNFSHDD